MAAKTVPCRAYFPGDPYREGRPCRCGTPLAEHPPFSNRSLQDVGGEIERLLLNYGHNCTVQNLLPELTRALAREV